MSFQRLATLRLRWIPPEQGGRKSVPTGSIYAATARFSENGAEFFSVVLRPLPEKSSAFTLITDVRQGLTYDLDFFAPELVVDQLIPGKKIWITEGPSNVAEGTITAIESTEMQKIRQQHTSPV